MPINDKVVEKMGFKFVLLKTGRHLSFWDCMAQAQAARTALSTGILRAFKTMGDDYDIERLEWLLDEVDSYLDHVRDKINKRRVVKTKQERIARLRNVTGRSPAEAEAFNRKADQLEAELHA
jgi:IMP cyclohydrolase